MDRPASKPSPNHLRAIRSRLMHLDRNLTIIERVAREGERGALHATSALPSEKADRVVAAVAEARERIAALGRELGIEPDLLPGERAIAGICSLLWETVVETQSRYLDAYGRVPDSLRGALDAASEELEHLLGRIESAARGPREHAP